MLESVVLWIALSLSPLGTSTGEFQTEQECRTAKAELAARIAKDAQPVLLSECFPVEFKPVPASL